MSEPLDLLLMPGLAFDWRGHRCGRGGGYYDKFLSLCQERAAKSHMKSPLLGKKMPAPHLCCRACKTPSLASALGRRVELLSATMDDRGVDVIVTADGPTAVSAAGAAAVGT